MDNKMAEIAFERLLLASKAVGLAIYDWDLLANQMYWNETMRDLFEIEDEKLGNYLSYFYSTIWP